MALLGVQESIGHERNRAWEGREVLVDQVVPARSHDHDEAGEGSEAGTEARDAFAHLPDGVVHLLGRSRESKLVHVAGPATALGTEVRVRIDHAGPYALRGRLA